MVIADAQQHMCCKLWNTDCEVKEGKQCKLTNIVINNYKDVLTRNSTDESQYTVSHLQFLYVIMKVG